MNQENIKHVAKETSSKKPDVHLNLTFQAKEWEDMGPSLENWRKPARSQRAQHNKGPPISVREIEITNMRSFLSSIALVNHIPIMQIFMKPIDTQWKSFERVIIYAILLSEHQF